MPIASLSALVGTRHRPHTAFWEPVCVCARVCVCTHEWLRGVIGLTQPFGNLCVCACVRVCVCVREWLRGIIGLTQPIGNLSAYVCVCVCMCVCVGAWVGACEAPKTTLSHK